MVARKLPKELRIQIREFLQNKRRRQRHTVQDGELILSQLSIGLRAKVASQINEQLLKELPFFLGADPFMTLEMALNMASVFYTAFEDVVQQGEVADSMYFVVAGRVEVLVNTELNERKRVAILKEKAYFGETALLNDSSNRFRNATVRTLVFSELRCLKIDVFLKVLEKSPFAKDQVHPFAYYAIRISHGHLGSDRCHFAQAHTENNGSRERCRRRQPR